MDLPRNFRNLLLLQGMLFIIPVNIYLLGDGVAAGVQWVIFRYQQSYLGNSFIVFYRDLLYIQDGYISGKSILAAELAFLATILMILASVILVTGVVKKSGVLLKVSAAITVICGLFYLISDTTQYGIFLNGPVGFIIPVGVPLMIVTGILIWRTQSLPEGGPGFEKTGYGKEK